MIRNRENEGCVFTHKNDFPKYDSHGMKQDPEEIIGCLEEEIGSVICIQKGETIVVHN